MVARTRDEVDGSNSSREPATHEDETQQQNALAQAKQSVAEPFDLLLSPAGAGGVQKRESVSLLTTATTPTSQLLVRLACRIADRGRSACQAAPHLFTHLRSRQR